MRKFSLAVLVVLGSSPALAQGFEGKWTWAQGSSSFDLELHVKGTQITGRWCGAAQNGNRLDCDGKAWNISGTVAGSSARVAWKSFYSGAKGQAVLTLSGAGQLGWKLTVLPKAGAYYCPSAVMMARVGAQPAAVAAPAAPAGPAATATFAGKWKLETASGYSFSLSLSVAGTKLSGQYCAITANASRIDCPDGKASNVSGTVSGNTATVTWVSAYGGMKGTAQLALAGGKLQWKLVNAPQITDASRAYFCPPEATLGR